jgi:3'-phosphoadenosine 5'-phosphosulfate sulfotransferase (PAPS reductase)/FAD synthetase
MDLRQIAEKYDIPYWKVFKIKKNLKIRFVDNKLNNDQVNLIVENYEKEFDISLKTKLLIYEFKDRFPSLGAEEIAYLFCLNVNIVKKIFKDEYLIIPSDFSKK